MYAVGIDPGSRRTRVVICIYNDGRVRFLGAGEAESQGWLKGRIADQGAVADRGDADLLLHLPDQRLFRCFAGFEMAAQHVPAIGIEAPLGRPPAQQNPAVAQQDGAGDVSHGGILASGRSVSSSDAAVQAGKQIASPSGSAGYHPLA